MLKKQTEVVFCTVLEIIDMMSRDCTKKKKNTTEKHMVVGRLIVIFLHFSLHESHSSINFVLRFKENHF